MTLEEYLEKSRDPLWYGEQDENGVELSLIRHALSLTPEQRLLRGDRGRRGALQLREYGNLQVQANFGGEAMTFEEPLEKPCDPRWYGEQDENGVDLSLIRENLRRTPTERVRRGDRATSDSFWIRANVRPIAQIKT